MSDTTIVTVSREDLAKMLDDAVSKAVTLVIESSHELWAASDLARHFGVSARTISEWVKQPGRLPPKQGRRWRRGEVLRWERERAAAGAGVGGA